PDTGFLDDIRPSHYIEDTRDLSANASRTESRSQSRAGRSAVPCRFQRYIAGFQQADCLYAQDSKGRPLLRCFPWKQLPIQRKAEGKKPTIGSGLSFCSSRSQPREDSIRLSKSDEDGLRDRALVMTWGNEGHLVDPHFASRIAAGYR